MTRDPHSRDLRKGRWLESGVCFATTTAVQGRRPILGSCEGQIIIDALQWLRSRARVWIYAFVIMPDHVHLLLSPGSGQTVSSIVSSWKKFSAREIGRARGEAGGIWQEGFYDHAIRDLRDAYAQHRYIIENPVRRDLVARPAEYLLSSANPNFEDLVDHLE